MKYFVLIFGLLFSVRSFAQPYYIDWHKVAGGGGTSTGGVYSLSGTIGQHDAGGPLTNINYFVSGGFWTIYAVQVPGAPLLTISNQANQVIVFWSPSATGWTLQTNATLPAGTWGNYLGTVVNNSAMIAPPAGNLFFRLKH
jgi:hypothetical protein